MLPTSSAIFASIRPGVCSRFRQRRTKLAARTISSILRSPVLGLAGASTALSEISGHPDSKWGGAVMGALQIKNIPTGAGDDIKVDVSYAKGDTKYVIATSGASPSFAMFGDTGLWRLSERWLRCDNRCGLSVRGRRRRRRHPADRGLGHPRRVQPQLEPVLVVQPVRQLLLGRYDGSAKANTAARGPTARLRSERSRRRQRGLYLQSRLQRLAARRDHPLDPGQEPDFLGGVQWFHLDQKFSGSCGAHAAAPKPTTPTSSRIRTRFCCSVRAQRNFSS